MDEQQAIEELRKIYIELNDCKKYPPFETAENAMVKRIPKKPIEKHYEKQGESPYIKTCCPDGCPVQVSKYDNYCCKCGQKIDWD